jgi:hypothetical protein
MIGSIKRGHARDRGVDLVLVEVGDLLQHLVHRAGLLADADHLVTIDGNTAVSAERAGHVEALGDLGARVLDGRGDDGVAGGLGADVERVEDRHARGEQRAQRAGEAGDDDLAQHGPITGTATAPVETLRPASLRAREDDQAESWRRRRVDVPARR